MTADFAAGKQRGCIRMVVLTDRRTLEAITVCTPPVGLRCWSTWGPGSRDGTVSRGLAANR